MKLYIVSVCLFAISAAAFTTNNLRHRRDSPELAPAVVSAEPPASMSLGSENSHRTVRQLHLRDRNRRDVSHLNRDYLPPAVKELSTAYLPPVVKEPSTEYLPPLPPAVKKAGPAITNEYLPPASEEPAPEEPAPEEESPVAPIISNEYLPPTEPSAVATEAPEIATEPEPEPPTTEAPVVESAVLLDDGYHYRQPEVEPDLSLPTREYLPPLEEGVVVAEGPAEDTAVLAEDGYHYRAIKRVRF